jgi:hypothetical protein
VYFDKIADYMPYRDTIHLPTWMTQKWLHKEYLEIMEALPEVTFDPLEYTAEQTATAHAREYGANFHTSS